MKGVFVLTKNYLMMKKSHFIYALNLFMVLVIVIFLTSCSEDVIEREEEAKIETETNPSNVIPGRYIVIVSKEPAVKNQKAAAILEELTGEVNKMTGAVVKMKYSQSLTGFAAYLNEKQVALLKKDKRVTAVYEDRLIYLEETNIQEYPIWGLDRLDQRDGLLDRVYAYNATGTGVNAYIIDSGIRYSHSEFEGRASLGVDLVKEYPDESYDVDDPDLEPGNDCGGHGTHVAGTVGGKHYGVAKGVNLISIRVFSCRGITSASRVIQSVDWVTENAIPPAVVNMSLGGGAFEPLDTAIENSIATGINYVLAAGNNDSDACEFSPARTPGALTVGASRINNYRAHFSNYGECLDLYAPGMDILSAAITDDISSVVKSGTSMAAPHIAGLAALFLEKNPDASPATLHEEIIKNSTPGIIEGVSAGPNNLAHSLWEPVQFIPPTPPNLNLRAIGIKDKGSNRIYLVWEPTDDPFVSIYKNGTYFARWYNTGEYSLEGKGNGSANFHICEEHYDNCSQVVTPNYDDDSGFEPNRPPKAYFTYEVNNLTVTFTDASFDEDGEIITRRWFFGNGYYYGGSNTTFDFTYTNPGTYQVQLDVIDNHQAQDTYIETITLTIEDPGDPGDPDPTDPSPGVIELSATGYKVKGAWQTDLSWSPAGTSTQVDIYRDGGFLARVNNTGTYTDVTGFKGGGSLTYEVCEAESTITCSNVVTVNF
jgi:hypothetical protein